MTTKTGMMTWGVESGPDGRERIFELWYSIEPFNPGSRDEPRSDASAAIETITEIAPAEDGSDHRRGIDPAKWEAEGFTKEELSRAEEAILEGESERAEERLADLADRKRDERRDW